MQTNDFIKELENANPHFSDDDIENNLWNGFGCDFEGVYLYKKHLHSLFIDCFNEIDNHIDTLLSNKSINEIKLFIVNKLNRFTAIRNIFFEWDNNYYLHEIESIDNKIKCAESGKWDENAIDYQLYGKESLIRMKQLKEEFQLEYDYLTYKIDKTQFIKGLNEWLTYKYAEEDGWDEESIIEYSCKLGMERICREYIDKSLKQFHDKYNFYLSTSTVQQNQIITEKEPTTKHSQIRQFTNEQKELLKTYFTSTFKGMGNNINYFDDNLMIDLQKK